MPTKPVRRSQRRIDKTEKVVKEKFLRVVNEEYEAPYVAPKFVPATKNQKIQLGYLQDGYPIVFGIGAAGSGKSIVAAYHGATLLKAKKIDKIYLVRPNVGVGASVGMLPGTLEEKLSPFFKQTFAHLEKFLGKGHMNYCKEKNVIEMVAIEHLRGYSFENAYIIIEECQGLKEEEFEMLMTRIGDGAQYCLTGDERQTSARDNSGLTKFINMILEVIYHQPEYLDKEDLDVFSNKLGIVRYQVEDIVRSGVCKAFCKLYYHRDS